MVSPFSFIRTGSKSSNAQEVPSSTSILQKSLRSDPFARRTRSAEHYIGIWEAEDERDGLNGDLDTLSGLFPNVQFEVFRELLTKYNGDSRLQIAVNQLVSHQTQWVNGRWQTPPRDSPRVPTECTFRSAGYKSAVHQFLSLEHRYLSRSVIDAVLAENNYSYTRARPTLIRLSRKTWRATIGNLNIFKKKEATDGPPPQLNEWIKEGRTSSTTGSVELDSELGLLFVSPARQSQAEKQLKDDSLLADELNETEARQVEALYDCECCCAEFIFEKMASCTTHGHLVCQDCLRKTLHEALFGQGWGRSVDPSTCSLKCLAPLTDSVCNGHVPRRAVRQAAMLDRSGSETWSKFEDRLSEDSLNKSRIALSRCPFCSYAEVDPSDPSSQVNDLAWHFRLPTSITTGLIFLVLIDLLPLILVLVIFMSFFQSSSIQHIFRNSLHHLSLIRRSPRFRCRKPGCLRVSCLTCRKAWHDPHTCHEPLLLSLRTTVETARTAAVKRTCPRCGLSFVKSSGCNKLTCVCGYSMCYLCRTDLGGKNGYGNFAGRQQIENTEGYRHFCEHFRINPGRPCTDCRKCDLYRSEDETAIVKRAGEIAEQEWRVKEGMIGVEGLADALGSERKGIFQTATSRIRTLQDLVDWFTGHLLEAEL